MAVTTRTSMATAIKEVAARDPMLAHLVALVGPIGYRPRNPDGHFAWGIDPPPTAKELLPLGEPFRPFRSIVARYCWEAVALFRGGTDPSLR